jgi:uncharacterized protein
MHVALVGATGSAGSRILQELVGRGHKVLGIARHIEKLPVMPGVTGRSVDVNDSAALATAIKGCEVLISSVKFKETRTLGLIDAARAAGVQRYLVVGGAGSLLLPDGTREMDSPKFPAFVLPEANAGGQFLDQLRATTDLSWTYISPSRFFNPGERTGKYRVGTDHLLMDASGKSAISQEDYAIALVDELEKPLHIRQRFTVGY